MKKPFFIFSMIAVLGCNDLGQSENWEYLYDGGNDSIFTDASNSNSVDSDSNEGLDTSEDAGIDLIDSDTDFDWIEELKKKCEGVVCDQAPQDNCLDRHRLQKYYDGGWCLVGECIYSWSIEECYICNNSAFGAYCYN